MNDADLERVIREYLPRVVHLSLSTCSHRRPWIAELHFGYDADLNLYFRSLLDRRHSREIAANPAIAGSIVIQHEPAESPLGVFFEGVARLLSSVADRRVAFDCLRARVPLDDRAFDESTRADGHWFYAISVETYNVYGALEGPARQKYELAWAARRAS
jgi:uncharacterized protein YhbP (UPF0306 family)